MAWHALARQRHLFRVHLCSARRALALRGGGATALHAPHARWYGALAAHRRCARFASRACFAPLRKSGSAHVNINSAASSVAAAFSPHATPSVTFAAYAHVRDNIAWLARTRAHRGGKAAFLRCYARARTRLYHAAYATRHAHIGWRHINHLCFLCWRDAAYDGNVALACDVVLGVPSVIVSQWLAIIRVHLRQASGAAPLAHRRRRRARTYCVALGGMRQSCCVLTGARVTSVIFIAHIHCPDAVPARRCRPVTQRRGGGGCLTWRRQS